MNAPCPGSGRKWQPGMGRAICPVCHRSAGTIVGAAPTRGQSQWNQFRGKTVPLHESPRLHD